MSSALASLPKVDRVLDAAPLAASPVARALKRRLVQEAIAELRARIQAGDLTSIPDAEALAVIVRARLDELLAPRPRRVINATGVVLHTNLGRAPLAPAAVQAMAAAAAACDLEIDLVSGRRGSRLAHLRPLLRALLGVDDVLVVNNGAAALLLACTALGGPGGLAIARGQMVEIGDGFRVAAMATAGGARLVEIGSTNRTHLADYRAALDGEAPGESGPATAILWVHLSNFRQEGFVHQAELAELAELARARGVPLIADLGSGSLGVGVPGGEPTIADYAAAGADLVTFSGDKLLGGPQAGILAGRAALVERCGRHPMARALRPDKTTIAALHATAAAHALEGPPPLPLLDLCGATVESLNRRAEGLRLALGWPARCVHPTTATIGGGSLPGDTLPGVALAVPGPSPTRLAARLRAGAPPVVGRIHEDTLLIDLRSVDPADDDDLLAALRALELERERERERE